MDRILGVMIVSLLMTSATAGSEITVAASAAADPAVGMIQAPLRPVRFVPSNFSGLPNRFTRFVSTRRSASDQPPPRVLLLVPSRAAVTTQAQPSLFWYISDATHPVRLTINRKDSPDPIIELTLKGGQMERGIQRLDLSKFDVQLHPAEEYEWAAMIIVDAQSPARNPAAKSSIWRPDRPDLAGELASIKRRRERARIAADRGIWVDALALIRDLIDERPNDPALLNDLRSLLSDADFDFDVASGQVALVSTK